LVILFAVLIECHNYITKPISRGNQAQSQTACRFGGEGNPTCAGPCDRKISQMTIPPIPIQRGDIISVGWVRHFHPGGFIRFAWAQTPLSDSHAEFDNGVDRFMCKEIGLCAPSIPSQPESDNMLPCGIDTLNVPLHLTNGAWTLQWAYFGGFFNAGDYYACVDYTITGGPTGAAPTVIFYGGDNTYPSEQKCKYFSTNALHICTQEPCLNATTPGEQSGPPAGFGGTPLPTTGGSGGTPPPQTTGNGGYQPTPTTGFTTTSNPPYIGYTPTTGIDGEPWCYKPDAYNLFGPIHNDQKPIICGKLAPEARCLENQCCSSRGECGPNLDDDGYYRAVVGGRLQIISEIYAFKIYCSNNTGDWRKVPCSSLENSVSSLHRNLFIFFVSLLIYTLF
jgi:hypothetical protein